MEYINLTALLNSVIFSFLGIIILLIGYVVLEKLTPKKRGKKLYKTKM